MSERPVLTLYPYLLNCTCWVFDDERTGHTEEAFVMGMTEMISRVVQAKGIRDAERGFSPSFSDQPQAQPRGDKVQTAVVLLHRPTLQLRVAGQPPRDTCRLFIQLLIFALVVLLRGNAILAAEPTPKELFSQAVQLFFEAKPAESARVFDQLVVAVPGAEPELWQRGLALYYAERYQDGRRQFELHKTVNPNDVENPAWHFLCVARLEGAEAARKALLPVGEDSRVPMAEIFALYAGRGTEAAVLEAAEKGEGEARKNQLCYAHLYLGLYAEALGDEKKAKHHITQAAGPYRMDHYMGKVAVMHATLRGWPVEAAGQP